MYVRNNVYFFLKGGIETQAITEIAGEFGSGKSQIWLNLVNCILPVREKHGFESMAMYINNVDYYQPDKSKVLSPEKIAIAAKCASIEPKIVFKNLFVPIL